MTRRPLIAGNWKMNTSRDEAVALATAIAANRSDGTDVVLCPPFPWLTAVHDVLRGSHIRLGAQNCWTAPKGAFTGEVSAEMLRGICHYVIVGHSERRQIFGETDAIVRSKIDAAIRVGLTPIVCVGETLETRDQGEEVSHVVSQVAAAFDGREAESIASCVVAYEPIWAIGTGRAASAGDAESMSESIRNAIEEIAPCVSDRVPILYGGSVTPENSSEVLAQSNVDGALVGGASLKWESFTAIVNSAAV
jgi:triosephosphate isomerase